MELQTKILEELAKGDRYPCQLYDELNLNSYRDLWQAIGQLKQQGKIKSYFSDTPPTATLTYTLVEQPKQVFPLVLWKTLNASNRTN